ncbi:hypothetical protein ASZ90_015822 [hydrocarbon metagenome]|uniref:Uncharacterized protein n=1 Tax=hydrocarbon metagenome TaxID=938273 RepID=A0A0W8F153_9ZZZZ
MTGDPATLADKMRGTHPPGNRSGESKTAKRFVASEGKKQKALSLRMEGRNYRDIAAAVGVSLAQAHRYVSAGLEELREKNREIAEDVKVLELERLDNLFKHAYQAVEDGEIRAIDQALKCMDRRARLLGLDAATRAEITGTLVTSGEWRELRAVLVGTLSQFPEAQKAVLAAIAEKTENNGDKR